MTIRKKRFRAFDPDPDCPNQCCDMPHCQEPAGYKAPKSRQQLNDYYWFCLEHIREYNKNWDYYKGMTPTQIEENLRASTVWDKPSWKLGQLGKANLLKEEYVKDTFGVFSDHPNFHKHNRAQTQKPSAPIELKQPLITLGLTWPISLEELKKQYTKLARQYHPDRNDGNVESTEQFKSINAAYSQIRMHIINSIKI